jgi:flotillin
MNSVPPLNDLFNMAGMKLPDYLGKEKQEMLDTSHEEVDKDINDIKKEDKTEKHTNRK